MKRVSLFLTLIFLLSLFALPGSNAFASEESVYTDVLDDLQKDESFDIANYPYIADDYSMKIIQLAESEHNQLFVYIYHPAAKYKATDINLSTGIGDNKQFNLYGLKFLRYNGVFYKYLVQGLEVKEDALRYYDVASIYRPWVEELDGIAVGDNTIKSTAVSIGQLWTACTVDDVVSYTCVEDEVVRITDSILGDYSISDSFYETPWYNPFGALVYDERDNFWRYYLAFSCDHSIDKLKRARVFYTAVTREVRYVKEISPLPSRSTVLAYSSEDVVVDLLPSHVEYTTKDDDWQGNVCTYEWDTIQTTTDFFSGFKNPQYLSNYAEIAGMTWVLNFAGYTHHVKSYALDFVWVVHSIKPENVSILELEFETAGVTYNLGVVDNKKSPSSSDIGSGYYSDTAGNSDATDIFLMVIMWIAVALAVFLCLYFIKPLSSVMYWVVYGIWFIISTPFKLLGTFINGIRENRGKK